MSRTKSRKVFTGHAIIILINIIAVGAILATLMTYFRAEVDRRKERNQEQFEAVVTAVGQNIIGRMEAHQELVDSASQYINSSNMTIEEAISYVSSISTDDEHMFHIVWTDDLTGLSTRANKLDDTDFTVDYSNISSIKFDSTKIINAMDMLYDMNGDLDIYATRAFNNPTDASSTIAFYNKVTLDRDGQQAEAIIMLLADVDSLRAECSFPEGTFEDTQTAIVDTETGYYVLGNPELKNSSFYEYLMQYNDLDYQGVEELKSELAAGDVVVQTLYDYKGQETRYIMANVSGAADWTLVSFLPMESLDTISQDTLWQVTITIVVLILALLVFDLVFFVSLNKRLEQARTEAEKANQAKTDFLSTMSHDIRTPLNAIIGFTTLTRQRLVDNPEAAGNLQKIEQSGQHLLTLINDILDISKIETGALNFNNNPFTMAGTDTYLEDLCGSSASEKGVTLNIDADIDGHLYLMGDKLRVYQVLINIMTNAVKYTNAGGRVDASLSVKLGDQDQVTIDYQVADTGIGMSPEYMEHMYEAFSRATDGRISKVQGTGLGLAICKKIIDQMGGTIDCSSKLNEGTTFTVRLQLPLAHCTDDTPEDCCHEVKNMHLLVAEDNDLNWEIISEMLSMEDITCDRAENGQIACDMLENSQCGCYDLVLMDIQMPVMNGMEATKHIRASEKEWLRHIPIIALTADAFAENIAECVDCGMNSHVAKPVNMSILMNEIEKLSKGV